MSALFNIDVKRAQYIYDDNRCINETKGKNVNMSTYKEIHR